ncbi:hypothetical protein [Chryseolinea sp. H1M3-3]|uniref:hypothetical protein n=1 Tax=Chryseolinea sp. H1M3-3 TaxID=3034144 RepID=UPI0023ED1FAA|nr:hypothetical protein [Chryseolinea sp. H1M3-3]
MFFISLAFLFWYQCELPPKLYDKKWIYSYEENIKDCEVYRTADYNFPISRGRNAFLLSADGTFFYFDSGMTDKGRKSVGTWELVERDCSIRATIENSNTIFHFAVVGINNSKLVVKRQR